MSKIVYTVHAYRWGDRERHSYSVGVYSKKHAALKAAQTESDYRGGKYECEVLEWTLDIGTEGGHETKPRTVLALPPMNTLTEDQQASIRKLCRWWIDEKDSARDGYRWSNYHERMGC